MGEGALTSGTVTVLQFELFPERSLSVCLVEGVENSAELRKQVLQQKFEASFLDAAMVLLPTRSPPSPPPSTTTRWRPQASGRCHLPPLQPADCSLGTRLQICSICRPRRTRRSTPIQRAH